MAHFARIVDGIVEQVIVVHNNELDDNGTESEAKGIAFCKSLFGEDTEWVQTSYNAAQNGFRGCYAGAGYTWKPDKRRKDGGTFEAPPLPIPPEVTPGE